MKEQIDRLVKQYILWPELENDFQKNINFSDATMSQFKDEIESILKTKKTIESQIALFYLTNEKLSKSRISSQDVLGEKELKNYDSYQKVMNDLSKDLMAYITVCCIVEARHVEGFEQLDDSWSAAYPNAPTLFAKTYPQQLDSIREHPEGHSFLKNHFNYYNNYIERPTDLYPLIYFAAQLKHDVKKILKDTESSRTKGYTNVATQFLNGNIEHDTMGQTFTFLKQIFLGDYFIPGYEGTAWAKITQHGLDFVTGKINAEIFIDQAFSLEHNNGNMFNKDFLFKDHQIFAIRNFFNKAYDDTISVSQILLNAQHQGSLSALFSLESSYEGLIKHFPELALVKPALPRDEMAEFFSSEEPSEKKGIELTEQELASYHFRMENFLADLQDSGKFLNHDLPKFIEYMEAVATSQKNLVDVLNPIKSYLNKVNPDLLKDSNSYVDIKGLFTQLDPENYWLLHKSVEAPDCMFDLWSHIHNNSFKPVAKKTKKEKFSFPYYRIDALPKNALNKDKIGSKALGLATMTELGLPVPKATVFGTECCHSYQNHRELFNQALADTMPELNGFLKSSQGNPILCSIRSGAPVSMPGMMDTILNVGIDSSNYDYFCDKMGKAVTDNCVNKFMELFCASRLDMQISFSSSLDSNLVKFREVLEASGIECSPTERFPLNRECQVKESIYAVFSSWNSERAKSYRAEKGIDDGMGTAAIVQEMVFGNLNDNSCTGVVFSRDCLTGENKMVGEFLQKAQGEEVVSGSRTPHSIEGFKHFNPKAYRELKTIAKQLEKLTGQIQDIEFTVESGKLYILQHRQAVCSPVAALKILEENSQNLNNEGLLGQITPNMLGNTVSVKTEEVPVASGLSANSGVMAGLVINQESDIAPLQPLFNEKKKDNPHFGWIFSANLTSPDHMPLMNKTQGFLTAEGGFTSHAAIIARSLNKPCVVGLGKTFDVGQILTVDATNGKVWEGTQPLVVNSQTAHVATKILLDSHKIDSNYLNNDNVALHALVKERANIVNEANKSWVFNFPEAKHITQQPVKKDKFLNLGQHVAMMLSADLQASKKLKMA